MSISAIGGTTTASRAGNLTLENFLQVLLTQLTHQDPAKPVDNQEFLAQIAQFTTLEQTQQLNSNIQALLNNQSSLQSVGLIGRKVTIATDAGALTGTVSALSLAGNQPLLTLTLASGATANNVSLSQITSVN